MAAVVIVMGVFAAFDGSLAGPGALPVLVSLTLFAVAYLAFGRPALGVTTPGARSTAYLVLTALAIGIGVIGTPMLATLQAVGYPLAWMLTAGRRQAIAACAAISLSVLAGSVIGAGGSAGGWMTGMITSGFSFIFAIALGLWITNIVEQRDERARLVAELTAAQAQIEALSHDRGAARERERLARDIHDTLAQTLAGLVLLAERAGRQSRDGRTDAAARSIATVEQVARDALAEARALVAQTAAVPAEPAFSEAVARLVERFRAEAGLSIEFHGGEMPGTALDREAQVVLLRCLQESLANVRKHAGAQHVVVRVGVRSETGGGTTAELVVQDDGVGFDPDAPRPGFGLDGMTERVALAGGGLSMSSTPGGGTALHVRLPVAAPVASSVEVP